MTSFEPQRKESTASRARVDPAKTNERMGNARIENIDFFIYHVSPVEAVLECVSCFVSGNDSRISYRFYTASRCVLQKLKRERSCFIALRWIAIEQYFSYLAITSFV
jgi:hypothetical protein